MLSVCEREVVTVVGVCPTLDKCIYEPREYKEEIIRCRDCKHVKLKFLRCKKSFTPIFAEDGKQIGFEESRIDPNGFCAWAERDA